ncbi:FAD/NAD(P)-binding domain-containing protein [Rhizoclosmatium globosum]|uniref:FAD/NAD(P)-binding domain-containing protein n=1 Tax=Rhizoclosmatium globosum TaxID=329046 RepID=A0A1Y2CEI7_9FUNG|nr:FAD/NAD(P)-binding domain-containing protein [Rhizoclosmatium globosum]|eukprot:ORY45478.1 FAD/NAD(P)-binding domain-containing protein [Rhizoclosmatium globosum]
MHGVIIGSGLVGATTALALKQVGIDSTLYDQVDLVQAAIASGGAPVAVDFGDSGGSVLMASTSLRVLRTLGLLEEVLAASLPSPTVTWFKINGTSPIVLDNVNANKKAGETDPALQSPIQILRSKLHNILMQACHKAGIRTFTGKNVTVQFADGTNATGDFVVGADGIHSATRRAMFGQSSKAEFTGVIGHIGVVKLKEHNIVLNEPCAMFIDRIYSLADIMESWGLPKNIEMMMRKPADLPQRPCLIIGDAAHGMVPNSGLGLLTGLEDVGVLLELFRNFPESKDLLKALNLYSKLRVPRGHDAAKRSRDMAKQYYEGSQTIGHILLRFGIFLFNYNIATLYKAYDCPNEVAAAIKAM